MGRQASKGSASTARPQAPPNRPPAPAKSKPVAPGRPSGTLAVEIDGVTLPDEDAVAVWRRFSEWMEEKNDLKGFAAEEGVASVKPTVKDGRPTLIVSR